MPKVGLVTVLFNSGPVLEGFFKSLSLQGFKDYHLYLIDNTPSESIDQQIQALLIRYPILSYTHVKNDRNVGVATGNNQGIKLAIADGCTHTLLLNNDIEFYPESLLEQMYQCAITSDEKMIIPKILYYDTRNIWMAGGRLRTMKGIIQHYGDGEPDGEKFNQPQHFNYAPTCFMLIDNTLFKEIGIMDEKYFVYYDDTDFIFRAVSHGYLIYYMPTLTVLHKVSSSTGGQESLFSIYYSTRNRIYFIRKNLLGIKAGIALIYTLGSRCIRLFQYPTAKRKEVLRAIKDGLAMKP